MDVDSTRPRFTSEDIVKAPKEHVSRRSLLKLGLLGTGAAAATLAGIDALAWAPQRAALASSSTASFPAVQYDIGRFLPKAIAINGVQAQLPPVFTVFLTATLSRTPSKSDQTVLAKALTAIESYFAFSPSGVFTLISYGLPYFKRLPGGLSGSLVSGHMPRLSSNTSRFVLEEAVASPTDITSSNGITKQTFNVPVKIESNDVLFSFRSDTLSNIQNVIAWFQGSNTLNRARVTSPAFNKLFTFTSMRTMFVQVGMPRQTAQQNNLSYTINLDPNSPMWMGFGDQQVAGSGPVAITTFQGNASAKLTTATSSDYFANGSIQHFSHVIQDLAQFYDKDEPYTERVQYMFRSDPFPNRGNSDQFTNGGSPAAFLANDSSVFLRYKKQGTTEAIQTAASPNRVNDPQTPGDATTIEPRMGHLSALQQSSRASDGTPIHIRMDGPGYDSMDVPGGSNQPKLQFSIFVPTADFFQTMRVNQAALKFQTAEAGFGGSSTGTVDAEDNGLERFLTATRRQNFLIPARAHRAFPLIELT